MPIAHLLIRNTDSNLSNQRVNPTAPSVPLNFVGSHFMNSGYEQPLTSGTAFIATAPIVGYATLGPLVPAAGPVLLEPPVSSAVAAALVVSATVAALVTSAALAAVAFHSATITACTLSAIIRSIAALLILFGGMILLITKVLGIIKKLYNRHDHDGK
ncbi:hypothetical protein Tco_0612213 [Tanacetum coccineum]